MTEEPGASARDQTPGFVRRNLFLIVLGLVIVVGLIVASSQQDTSDTSNSGEDLSSQAKEVCRNSVKDQLKAPATAQFSDEQASGVGDTWAVTGSVDSENSFGALIRNTYTCDAIHGSGLNWRTRSTLSEN